MEVEAGVGGTAGACRALGLARSSYYRISTRSPEREARAREIVALSEKHPRYGYRRITAMLDRAQPERRINAKAVQRVRSKEGLQVRRKQRRMKRLGLSTSERQRAQANNAVWSWDFVYDQTENGESFRVLTLIDEYNRRCLATHVGRSIKARDVITVVEAAFLRYGKPLHLRSDNGPEFIAYAIVDWLAASEVKTLYIKPGSPWENGHIESFHDKLRDECLNRELFGSLLEARVVIEQWRCEYNHQRPHSSLGYQTPEEYAALAANLLRSASSLPPQVAGETSTTPKKPAELHL